MKTQSIDTDPATEQILISLIRKMSMAEKFSQILSLSQTAIDLSKRAISRANVNLTEEQLNLLFIEYHYGKDLADRVKNYLKNRHENT